MNGRPSLTPALLLPFLAACAMSTEPSVTEESTPSTTSESTPSSEEDTGGRLVVDLIDGTMLDEARAATGLDLEWVSPLSADESLAVVEVANFERALSELEDLHLVEAAEPSMTYVASAFPNDPMHEKQWNFRKIGAASGWRVGAGEGVTVAVIDTGVSAVPDLEGTELLPGATFVPGTRTADDDNGHGTHVAGTIAQTTHNGLGVAGLAPRATVLPIKALSGSGMGRSEWIASAIDEATDQGADIINLSLGGSRSKVIEVAVDKAVAKGVLVVAAAGNSGREGVGWPAAHPAVLGVSATGPTDDLAFYSSWGKGVVLSAPGGDMRQPGGGILQDTVTSGDHAFKELQGTSMASPHVAGAAAVLMGAGATSGADARSLLEATAVDLGEPGPDARFGIGRIDLGAAVHALTINRHGLLFGLGALVALFMTALGSVRPRHPGQRRGRRRALLPPAPPAPAQRRPRHPRQATAAVATGPREPLGRLPAVGLGGRTHGADLRPGPDPDPRPRRGGTEPRRGHPPRVGRRDRWPPALAHAWRDGNRMARRERPGVPAVRHGHLRPAEEHGPKGLRPCPVVQRLGLRAGPGRWSALRGSR